MSILLELFDRTVDWEYSDESKHGHIKAEFVLPDADGVEIKYEVDFVEEANETELEELPTPFPPNTGGAWDISFTSRIWDWTSGTYGRRVVNITGGGNEFIVLSTIMNIIHKTVDRYSMNNIMFGAAKREQSRVKLYTRMVQIMRNEWAIIPPAAVAANYSHITSPEHDTWMLARK